MKKIETLRRQVKDYCMQGTMNTKELNHRYPILVVEDDPLARKILVSSLVKAGHKVTSVANGRKALELFKEKYFPIVLTDWIMPEINGLELCKAIREDQAQGYVFIIILTCMDSKDDIVVGLESGADDYLSKPYNQAELKSRIKTGIRILELERSLKKANDEIHYFPVSGHGSGTAVFSVDSQGQGVFRRPQRIAAVD